MYHEKQFIVLRHVSVNPLCAVPG